MPQHLRKRDGVWHIRINVAGTEFTGSTGTANAKEAQRFLRERIQPVIQAATLDALHELRRSQLLAVNPLPISEAWTRYAAMPRKKQAGSERAAQTESRWLDFVASLPPDVRHLAEVTATHARAYVQQVDARGIAPATANEYRKTCRMVFDVLKGEAGLPSNPFADIPLLVAATECREAFTPAELKLIGEQSKGTWIYDLFMICLHTGLREGDACRLVWPNVDLVHGIITVRTSKTGEQVEIPILPPLRAHLEALASGQPPAMFVHPALADKYMNQRTTIGRDVAAFLEGIGIKTTRAVEGRKRPAKVKDIHSLRHTFCYLASIHGVSLPVVQSVVGHMDSAMTQRYMDHATREDRAKAFGKMPEYLTA